MTPTQFQPITILLDKNAHRYAKQFASEQINPTKGKRVYLNTLTAYGVHTYLKCLNLNSNIAHSDCWQTGYRALFDVADITLPQGKLECLWLLPGETEATIPLIAREERLAYVVARLTEELQQIELLGFIPSQAIKFDTESIAIDRLQPLENLFDAIAKPPAIDLSQWLADVFTTDWQPVETILAGRMTRSLAVANSITRGKTIQWQLNSLDREIILILQVQAESEDAIDLRLQLYPGQANSNLPAGLSVAILDESDRICLSAEAQDLDDWMQLEFSCQLGEEFKVEMNLAGVSVVEEFIV